MNEFTIFFDVKYLIFVILGTAGLTLVSFSPKEILANLKFALNGDSLLSKELSSGKMVWKAAARNAYILGVTGAIIRLILLFEILESAEGSSGIKEVMTTIAAGIQPLIYGLALACVLMILAWRREQKVNDSSQVETSFSPLSIITKISGYLIMFFAFVIIFFRHSIGYFFVFWPLIVTIFGGAFIVYLLSRNKFALTPALGFLGFIIILMGISKMLYSMGIQDLKEVAAAMLTSVLSLFYILLGVLYAGIPIDDHQVKRGKKVPLMNKLIYLFIPIIAMGIYLFTFIMIITPITRR